MFPTLDSARGALYESQFKIIVICNIWKTFILIGCHLQRDFNSRWVWLLYLRWPFKDIRMLLHNAK